MSRLSHPTIHTCSYNITNSSARYFIPGVHKPPIFHKSGSLALPPVQYQFELDDGRSNQLFSLINNSGAPAQLSEISFMSNADIQSPWGGLGAQWQKATRIKQGDFYIYTLMLDTPITLNPGKNKVLEYSVGNALGPITNVAMPPRKINIKLQGGDTEALTSVDSNNSASNPHPNIEFNMYHANWGQYAYKKDMTTEDFAEINCLSYAFIGFDESGNVKSLDTWADQLDLVELAIKKQQYPYLKTSLSFGGWTNAGKRMDSVFSNMAANPDERAKFVANAVRSVLIADADGIDIDWEYATAQDANNFVLLLQELRAALNAANIPNARLTIAAPASVDNIRVFDQQHWQAISAAVDRISVMNYDYFGAFSDVSDFHSPYNLSLNSPHAKGGGSNAQFCVAKTMAVYDALGVPKNKMAMGIPNYARGMIVEKVGDYAGLYQPIVGAPIGDFGDDSGIFSWESINNFRNNKPSSLDSLGLSRDKWKFYDSNDPLCLDAKMCLLSGELPNGNCVVLTFLDPASATWRAQQAQAQNLGGVMMWANYEDSKDPAESIAHAVSEGLNSPPSYQEAMQNSFAPPSYQEAGNPLPPSSYEEVLRLKEREALSNLSEIEKLFCAHLSDLSNKSGLLASQKCQIMFDLFTKKIPRKKCKNILTLKETSFLSTEIFLNASPPKYLAKISAESYLINPRVFI